MTGQLRPIRSCRPVLDRANRLTFLVLDLGLDIFDSVTGLDLKGDGLPRQRLHEDLHVRRLREVTAPLVRLAFFKQVATYWEDLHLIHRLSRWGRVLLRIN